MPPTLIHDLTSLLGEENVAYGDLALDAYRFDGLRPYRAYPDLPRGGFRPDVCVTPRSTEEVAEVARLAYEARVPVVPYGGGTGLMGGALAVKGGVTLDLRKMNRVLGVDEDNRWVEAEAGATLDSVDAALAKVRLRIGHDPWTRHYATVGGAISTNGLGYLGGKYGAIGEQVLGLTVVLPRGQVLKIKPVARSSTGPDLKRLFIGSEGTLGIVTEATLRAFPKPEEERVYGFRLPSFEAGYLAVTELFRLGLKPASLDLSAPSHRGPAELFLALSGFREEVEACEARAAKIIGEAEGTPLGPGEAEEYWATRYEVAHRFSKASPHAPNHREEKTFDYIHVSLPPRKVLEYRETCYSIAERHRVQLTETAIWLEPELFSATFRRGSDVSSERLEAAIGDALHAALAVGGSVEYCHGVGIRLARFMGSEHGFGLEVMRLIKQALDPLGLLNPGKLGM